MHNIAVILAGGTGTRMGGTMPKQFMPLGGRTVVEHSIDTFERHPAIDEIAVVVHPAWRQQMETIVAGRRWSKLSMVIDGGQERYLSTLNAIMAFIDRDDESNLLFHDAARPLVSEGVITRVVSALRHCEAVGVAVPCTDTIWEVHPDMAMFGQESADGGSDALTERFGSRDFEMPRIVARIPERRLMWQAQTPQAFRLPLIRDAYQRALQDPQFAATDDCSVVRRYMPGTRICVVEGETANFKLTTADDMRRAEIMTSDTTR